MTTLSNPVERVAVDGHRKVSPAKFAHVVLLSSKKQEMLDWYRTVLDGEVVFDSTFIGFVTYDDEHHRVAIADVPELIQKTPFVPGQFLAGMHHFAFTYATLDDLMHTYERLKASGIVPEVCTNHGPTISFYYLDPDDNRVELQIDVFETNEETTAFFYTQEFLDNPVGVDFDPEEFLADYKRGVTHLELKKRPNIGERARP